MKLPHEMPPEWQMLEVRATWFVPSGIIPAAGTLFEEVLGFAPDSSQTNKSVRPEANFLSQATGQNGKKKFSVTVQPNRLDLALVPLDAESVAPAPPAFLDAQGVFSDFCELAKSACRHVSGVVRIALVPRLGMPQDTLELANSTILENMLGGSPIEGATELEIQINKQIVSGVEGVLLNRLIKLSAASYQILNFSMSHGGGRIAQPASPALPMVEMLLDMNTVPTPNTLADLDLANLFDSLKSASLDIMPVENGLSLAGKL